MNYEDFGSLAIGRIAKNNFGIDLEVSNLVCERVSVGAGVYASVILTRKKHLYVLVQAQGKQTYGDVRKVVRRMGLVAEAYLPPRGFEDYFNEIARQQFAKVFPGRRATSDEDVHYYRTLVPYNPALVRISQVVDGTIYCHDRDAASGWRPCAKLTYRRIPTS